jgi:hypothetical protein
MMPVDRSEEGPSHGKAKIPLDVGRDNGWPKAGEPIQKGIEIPK